MADTTELGTLLYERDGHVAIIRLNRPDRMNTIGSTMKPDLATAFDLARKEAARCVILTGVGDRAFCAGADIKERAGLAPTNHAYHIEQRDTHALLRMIETFEAPVIAAINGVALGGGLEIALCADVRLAAERARFGLPEVKLGALPAAGGTQRLPRTVGVSKALEMVFTADMIDAEEARRIGLVSRVTANEALEEEALEMARKIAALPPLAIRFAKHSIRTGNELSIDQGLEIERYAAAMLVDTEDRKEGMRAFVEKRAPNFIGA